MGSSDLKREIVSCKLCSFSCEKYPPLPPATSQGTARVIFIGENPSWAEHQEEPFSNLTISGKALRDHYLKPLQLSESEVWITDLFKCRYPKKVWKAKPKHENQIQNVATICARQWLLREILESRANLIVTLSDRQVYQRLRRIFEWNVPSTFKAAVGKPHPVVLKDWAGILFPMVHPDISRPISDGDGRKRKTREKWAPIHRDLHIRRLRELLAR